MTHPRSTVWCAGRVICDALEDREGWIRARFDYICASEAGKALGEPWTSGKNPTPGPERYASLIEKKRAREINDDDQRENMWWAQLLEEHIIAGLPKCRWAPTFGWSIRPCGLLIGDPECRDLAATTDMWMDDGHGPMVGDLKDSAFGWKPSKDKPKPDLYVPKDYQIQIQAQMACTGAMRGCLVQKAEGRIYNCIVYDRDEAMIKRIRQAAEWAMMEVRAAA